MVLCKDTKGSMGQHFLAFIRPFGNLKTGEGYGLSPQNSPHTQVTLGEISGVRGPPRLPLAPRLRTPMTRVVSSVTEEKR